jgi:hypothetical protein
MNVRKLWFVWVTVGVLTFVFLPAAAASTQPAVVQVRSTAKVTLPDAAGTLQQVEAVTLGKGSWTVTSNLTAINFGAGDFVRCQLQANGRLIDGGATTYLADRVSGVVNAAALVAHGTVTVAVLCDHDHNAVSPGQFYIDPGATVTAVRGGPISAPGVTSSGAPVVVESRTTASVTLANTGSALVTSVSLAAGTWAITANASAVNFSDFDWASCYLTATSGTGTSVGTGGDDSTVSEVDVEASANLPLGGLVALVCRSTFASNVYIDAGATLTATKVASSAMKSAVIPQTALPDVGGSQEAVLTQKVPAGAWRVRTEVQAGNMFSNGGFGGDVSDFIRCSLSANGAPIDDGATVLVTDNSTIDQVVNAGSFTSTKGWTLRLSCSHDIAEPGPGHWTVAQGNALAIKKGPIS